MVGRDIKSLYVESDGGEDAWAISRCATCASSRYPQKRVSFDASRGEILGFAGLVGAGRSEMAKAMVGLDPRGGGQITLGDETLSIRHARRRDKPGASIWCPKIGAPRA